MVNWPFANPKSGGYVTKAVIDDAEMALLAQQANVVASGKIWNELTPLANWQIKFEIHATPFAPYGKIFDAVYDTSGRQWYIVGDDDIGPPSDAIGGVFYSNASTGSDVTALTIANFITYQPKVVTSDEAGTIVMAGGNDSSSAEKFRYVTSSGTSFSVSSVASASTAIATGVVWDSINSLFIACFDDGSVHYDADGQGTWTQVSGQFEDRARTSIATNDLGRTVISSANHVLVSTDGTTWTENQIGGTSDGYLVWVGAHVRKFFLIGETTVFSSSDGEVWSSVGLSALGFDPRGLSVNRRCIACLDESLMAVVVSTDGAKTWRTMFRLTDAVPNDRAAFKYGPFGAIAVGTEDSNAEDDELFISFHAGM